MLQVLRIAIDDRRQSVFQNNVVSVCLFYKAFTNTFHFLFRKFWNVVDSFCFS